MKVKRILTKVWKKKSQLLDSQNCQDSMIQHILNNAQAFILLIYFSLYFFDHSLQHIIYGIKQLLVVESFGCLDLWKIQTVENHQLQLQFPTSVSPGGWNFQELESCNCLKDPSNFHFQYTDPSNFHFSIQILLIFWLEYTCN